MKYYIKLMVVLSVLSLFGCQEDDQTFGAVVSPSNLTIEAVIQDVSSENPYGAGSGLVDFVAHADNAISYKFVFGDNTTAVVPSGETTHGFALTGVNEYVVTVIASGTGGASTTATVNLTVFSAFEDPESTQALTGGSSKTWYIAKALPGHLGLGPTSTTTQDWYSAGPNEKGECFYNDEFTFTLQSDGSITFVQDNMGETFVNVSYLEMLGASGGEDTCISLDTSGVRNVTLSGATSGISESTGTQMTLADGGFMGYFVNQNSYEIMEITNTYMYVRFIMAPPGDTGIAWYMKFTTDPNGGAGGGSTNTLDTEFTNLVWSDEFNQASLDTSIWNYEIGNNSGWGNGELQYYTNSNTSIADGILSITAKAESINGYNYSSSRITTEGNYQFQYGRMEVRAKLTDGGGTWPAIWMLGSNYGSVGWPACGEVDVMEYVGNSPNQYSATIHYPGNSGGDGITASTSVSNATSEFHNYTVEWSAEHIVFAIDDVIFQEIENTSTLPFNQNFFIILNVAMGGSLGGTIDPAFTQSAMEIDYVRVYQ